MLLHLSPIALVTVTFDGSRADDVAPLGFTLRGR